jgi:2-polyprenyl-3-methyl-5-hydroxy-6-metoxy-1,4-benzoquinol methylase
VTDTVSQAVRQQYEENPYPRWRRRGGMGQGLPMHLALQRRLPQLSLQDTSPPCPEILVAGCGTGSDASQVARTFAHAQILAVDISRTSLAYAKRATQELNIKNIDFRQADILELGSLKRQFDLIVCSGVLHHMRDPLQGWRVLTSLLRTDGYMNIGLYSRRARRHVTALRQLVQNQSYASTPEGIRRFRTDVMTGKNTIDVGTIAMSPDFYSTSACRDLIFHVQEHVFTPLEIASCLDGLGLQFLGFEFSNPEIRNRYITRFPDNPACDCLANWEVVEEENPDIFAGMYQFWVKKRV